MDDETRRRREDLISSICSWNDITTPSSRKRTAVEVGDLSDGNNSQMSSTDANRDGRESVAMKEFAEGEIDNDDGFQLTVDMKEAWTGLLPPSARVWHDLNDAELEEMERLKDEDEEKQPKCMSLLVTSDMELLNQLPQDQFNAIKPAGNSMTEAFVIRGIVSEFTARLIKQVDIRSPLKADLDSHLQSVGDARREVANNGKHNRLMNQMEGAAFLLSDDLVTLTRTIAWEYACKIEICLQPVSNATLDHIVTFESNDLNGERTDSWAASLNANTIDELIGQLSEKVVKAIEDATAIMAQLGVDQSMDNN